MGQRDASSKLSVQQSVVHYFKINRPRGKWQWTFLGLVTLQIIFGVAMEGTILVFTRNALEYIDLTLFPDFFTSKDLTGLKSVQAQFEQNTSPLVVVHLLFIFTLALQIVYTYDALARRNTLQIVGIIILNLYLVIWSVLTFMSTDSLFNALTTFRGGILTVDAEAAFTNNIRVASISIIAIIAVISVALVAIFVVSLYKQFGWATYDALGADPEIKMYNRDAEILYTLLKFDYKFYITWVVIIATCDGQQRLPLLLLIPLIMIALVSTATALKYEMKKLMIGSIVGVSLGCLGVIIASIFNSFNGGFQPIDNKVPIFSIVKIQQMTVVFTVFLHIATIWFSVRNFRHFGKGLYQKRAAMAKYLSQDPDKRRLDLEEIMDDIPEKPKMKRARLLTRILPAGHRGLKLSLSNSSSSPFQIRNLEISGPTLSSSDRRKLDANRVKQNLTDPRPAPTVPIQAASSPSGTSGTSRPAFVDPWSNRSRPQPQPLAQGHVRSSSSFSVPRVPPPSFHSRSQSDNSISMNSHNANDIRKSRFVVTNFTPFDRRDSESSNELFTPPRRPSSTPPINRSRLSVMSDFSTTETLIELPPRKGSTTDHLNLPALPDISPPSQVAEASTSQAITTPIHLPSAANLAFLQIDPAASSNHRGGPSRLSIRSKTSRSSCALSSANLSDSDAESVFTWRDVDSATSPTGTGTFSRMSYASIDTPQPTSRFSAFSSASENTTGNRSSKISISSVDGSFRTANLPSRLSISSIDGTYRASRSVRYSDSTDGDDSDSDSDSTASSISVDMKAGPSTRKRGVKTIPQPQHQASRSVDENKVELAMIRKQVHDPVKTALESKPSTVRPAVPIWMQHQRSESEPFSLRKKELPPLPASLLPSVGPQDPVRDSFIVTMMTSFEQSQPQSD